MKSNYFYISVIMAVICFSCTGSHQENSTDLVVSKLLSELMFIQFESEDYPLDFKIDSLDNAEFFTQIEKLPKLVFFHSELDCNSCIEENILVLNTFNKTIGNENIIFLASYKNKRDLTVFKRTNRISCPVYNVSSVGLPIEEAGYPFCFVINKNHEAECVFVPIKENEHHFKRYLKIIKNKYFNEENDNTANNS